MVKFSPLQLCKDAEYRRYVQYFSHEQLKSIFYSFSAFKNANLLFESKQNMATNEGKNAWKKQ
jgi:hypothetical protein